MVFCNNPWMDENEPEVEVTILILIDGFLQSMSRLSEKEIEKMSQSLF